MELYKKHRPKTLRSVVGNEDTVKALENMLAKRTLPHTILFHGPSGCGKTTLARILKNELHCNDLDFREVNSSSYRGIDSIRDISSNIHMAPIGSCRVWLMDEVHKLSNDAQNAALKMLEDTPSHVYFFLCTTESEKLIKAIRTRCCEMPVRLLTEKEMKVLVGRVSKKENIELNDEITNELVMSSQGSARLALVLLEKISHLDPAQRKDALQRKLAEENKAYDLCQALIRKEPWKNVTAILKNMKDEPETVRWSVLGYARAVLLNGGQAQERAYVVLDCFKNNFYDSKEAGLARACFEVIFGE